MTYKVLYQVLLGMAKSSHWKVSESPMKRDQGADGYIDVEMRRIVIQQDLSYKRKCVTLSHELIGHGMQWDSSKKKFRRFFNAYRLPDTKKNRRYVSFVEIDASRRAAKFFKAIGIKGANKLFEELGNGEEVKWLKIFWADRYLLER